MFLGASVASTGKSSSVWAAGVSLADLAGFVGSSTTLRLPLSAAAVFSVVAAFVAITLSGRASVGAALAGLGAGSAGFSAEGGACLPRIMPSSTGRDGCDGVTLVRRDVASSGGWLPAAGGGVFSITTFSLIVPVRIGASAGGCPLPFCVLLFTASLAGAAGCALSFTGVGAVCPAGVGVRLLGGLPVSVACVVLAVRSAMAGVWAAMGRSSAAGAVRDVTTGVSGRVARSVFAAAGWRSAARATDASTGAVAWAATKLRLFAGVVTGVAGSVSAIGWGVGTVMALFCPPVPFGATGVAVAVVRLTAPLPVGAFVGSGGAVVVGVGGCGIVLSNSRLMPTMRSPLPTSITCLPCTPRPIVGTSATVSVFTPAF